VLPSGRSLIAKLLTMTNQLVIEDADLLPCRLERHFVDFKLDDLCLTDLTAQAKRRGEGPLFTSSQRNDWGRHHTTVKAACKVALPATATTWFFSVRPI
jgi:hypothetical protein